MRWQVDKRQVVSVVASVIFMVSSDNRVEYLPGTITWIWQYPLRLREGLIVGLGDVAEASWRARLDQRTAEAERTSNISSAS